MNSRSRILLCDLPQLSLASHLVRDVESYGVFTLKKFKSYFALINSSLDYYNGTGDGGIGDYVV